MINSLKKKNVCEYIGIVPKPIENSTIKYLYKFDLFCARYYQIDITVHYLLWRYAIVMTI